MVCAILDNPALIFIILVMLWVVTRKIDKSIETLSVKYDRGICQIIRTNRSNQSSWFSVDDSVDLLFGVPKYILTDKDYKFSWFHFLLLLYLLLFYAVIPLGIISLFVFC